VEQDQQPDQDHKPDQKPNQKPDQKLEASASIPANGGAKKTERFLAPFLFSQSLLRTGW
jgi:hypothetical protein